MAGPLLDGLMKIVQNADGFSCYIGLKLLFFFHFCELVVPGVVSVG